MDLKKSKCLMTSPYWPTVLVAAAFLLFAYLRITSLEYSNRRTLSTIVVCLILGCHFAINGLVHYSVDEAGIWIRFAYIPIRRVAWSNVLQAIYIQKWTTGGKNTINITGHGIIVTLLGCVYFDPDTDGLTTFLLKHPIGACWIRFTAKSKDRYLEIFSRYCELQVQEGATNKEI